MAAGLGQSIAAGVQAKKAADQARADYKEKQNLIANAMAEDEAWFNKQYYQDITQRTDVQNMLRKLDEQQKKAQTANAARAAVTGATPEAQLAAQDSVNQAHANAIADIASNASAMKDQYLTNWRNRQNDYYRQRLALQNPETTILSNQSNQLGQAANNMFSSGSSLLANGLGGSNSSTKATDNTTNSTTTNAAPSFARTSMGATPSYILSGNADTYGSISRPSTTDWYSQNYGLKSLK